MQADYGTCELPTDRGLARASLTPDEDIYRDWLLKAQAASPDEEVRKAELVLDAYNVVDKHEYPPAARLDPGHPQAYNAIMMTGSSESQKPAGRGEGRAAVITGSGSHDCRLDTCCVLAQAHQLASQH